MVDILRKEDAKKIKEHYQQVLDWAHEKVKKQVYHLYKMNHKLKNGMSNVQKYKKDIVADEEERGGAYEALGDLLKKEEGHEGTLWKETTLMYKEISKNQIGGGSKIKQKTKHGDQEMRFASMMKVLDKYPEYQTKSLFKSIKYKIIKKEKEIKITKKKYNRAVTDTIREIAYFPQNFKVAEDLVKKFEGIMKEGKDKLKNMRFNKSIFFRWSGESKKMGTQIQTLYYEMDKFKNTIQQLKEEVEKARKQDLEEMAY